MGQRCCPIMRSPAVLQQLFGFIVSRGLQVGRATRTAQNVLCSECICGEELQQDSMCMQTGCVGVLAESALTT